MRRNEPGIAGSETPSHAGEIGAMTLPTCNIDQDLHIFAEAYGRDIQNRGEPQGG